MNIVIFCLMILICWGIIRIALRAWNKADITERKKSIVNLEDNYKDIIKFKKEHKGNLVTKQDYINRFTKE